MKNSDILEYGQIIFPNPSVLFAQHHRIFCLNEKETIQIVESLKNGFHTAIYVDQISFSYYDIIPSVVLSVIYKRPLLQLQLIVLSINYCS